MFYHYYLKSLSRKYLISGHNNIAYVRKKINKQFGISLIFLLLLTEVFK